MSGLRSGWNMPPGCHRVPGDEDVRCEVCGRWSDDCVCPECDFCGEIGDPRCYEISKYDGVYRGCTERFSPEAVMKVTGEVLPLRRSAEQIESRATYDASLAAEAECDRLWAEECDREERWPHFWSLDGCCVRLTDEWGDYVWSPTDRCLVVPLKEEWDK